MPLRRAQGRIAAVSVSLAIAVGIGSGIPTLARSVPGTDCATLQILNAAPSGIDIEIDEPRPYTIYQRDGSGSGTILVRGRCRGESGVLEARFADGDWRPLGAVAVQGEFEGSLADTPAGCGSLEVRRVDRPETRARVDDVGVGDVFVVTGQSNAAGQGATLNPLDRELPAFASVFREDLSGWAIADDPMTPWDHGSPWPRVAGAIIERTKVPVGFITVTDSSQSVLLWRPGHPLHDRVLAQISKATGGTMRVRAILWFQGERDMRRSDPDSPTAGGDREVYEDALLGFIDSILSLTSAEAVVVGQSNINRIDDAPLGVAGIDHIRAAQSALWSGHEGVRAGPVTYDISLGDPAAPGEDIVHFVTDLEISTFADRWFAALDRHFYRGPDGVGPRLARVVRLDARSFELHFTDESLPLTSDGPPGGFTVQDGDRRYLTELSAVIGPGGDTVLITAPVELSSRASVSLGTNIQSWDRPALRDSSRFRLPAVPFYEVPIDPASGMDRP